MIELRPRDTTYIDRNLKERMDNDYWYPLGNVCGLMAEDFTICQVKVNGVIYDKPSDKFWKEYNKEFAWLKLRLS